MIDATVEPALDAEPATNTMIRTVGIISRPRREDIARVVPPLIEWLRAHGVEVVCDSETGECIGPLTGQTRKREELPAHSDLLIVLGGDGTLLSAARLAAAIETSTPVCRARRHCANRRNVPHGTLAKNRASITYAIS